MDDPARQLAALAQHGGIEPLPTDFITADDAMAYMEKAMAYIAIHDVDLAKLTGSYVLGAHKRKDGNDQALLLVFAATIEALRRSILDAAYANRAGAQPTVVRSPEAPSPSTDAPSNN